MKLQDTDLVINGDGSVYHLQLRPEEVSEKIILVGDPGRVSRVSRQFEHIELQRQNREFITHTGSYRGKRITVMSTGMGPDNIEIALIELDALYNLDFRTREIREETRALEFVRIGTSGGIQPEIGVGSLVAARYGIGLDNLMAFYPLPQGPWERSVAEALRRQTGLDISPYVIAGSEALFRRIAHDMLPGNTVTTPGFYAPQGRAVRTGARNPGLFEALQHFELDGFRLSNFEMETSAIYALSALLGHSALSVNVILANRPAGKFSHDAYAPVDEAIARVLERI
jgi:uridine phosphorylase